MRIDPQSPIPYAHGSTDRGTGHSVLHPPVGEDTSTHERARRLWHQPKIRHGLPALIEALAQIPTFDSLTEKVPAHVAEYLGCRRVLLYLVRDNMLNLVSSTDDVTERGWASTLVRLVPINPIPLDARVPETEAIQRQGTLLQPGEPGDPARIIAPMYGLHGPVGALVLIPGKGEAAWGENDLPASQMLMLGLEDVARVTSLVLECQLLFTQNHQRAEVMDLLMHLTMALNNRILDLDTIIGIVERQIIGITHAEHCAVILLGPNLGRAQASLADWIRPEMIRMVVQMQAPLQIDRNQEGFLTHLLLEEMQSFYGLPLLVEDHVVGVVAIAHFTRHTMEDSERDLLTILTHTASTVLQRAKLFAEAEQARSQARDMRERAQNEERFKDAILRNIQSGIITFDLEGRVTLINHEAATLLDLGARNGLGQPIEEVMPSIIPGMHVVRACLGSRMLPVKREVRVRTSAEREILLDITIADLRQADGREMGILCAFQDLTPIRAMESEMRRLETISTVGTEASNISHDMRNIITNLTWGIQNVVAPVLGGDEARTSMDHIRKELNRLTALADNMMNLTKPKMPHPQPYSAASLIESCLRNLEHRLMMGQVEVIRHVEAGAMLFVDELQILRVLENLCINAIEAMPKGGTLTIAARTTRSGLRAGASKAPDRLDGTPVRMAVPYGTEENQTELLMPDHRQRAVEIAISDTGAGIPPERLTDIWKPFKTFGKRQGTGLGLAIVRQSIEAHGGMIDVDSKVGQGTTFTLRLPGAK